ncbi:uncharacterized protein [Aegilops tauschii subsp. strangulata]|uniref:uncharacterized protein n=1 Tax=Aegilops tauschii subsp. strangulata TaxID=200361 RepID=UPI00098A0A84|nr:uncharacterized protein LOC109749091 [Aegilops tauschii subsp. strangulata]
MAEEGRSLSPAELELRRRLKLSYLGLLSFRKIFSKVLANRLAPLLPTLVSKCQSAFVQKCPIHNNFLHVQNHIKDLHRRNIPGLFLKLDISKAFDSVNWAFLLEVMQRLGFGQRWRD